MFSRVSIRIVEIFERQFLLISMDKVKTIELEIKDFLDSRSMFSKQGHKITPELG